jgi:hypothetical protein
MNTGVPPLCPSGVSPASGRTLLPVPDNSPTQAESKRGGSKTSELIPFEAKQVAVNLPTELAPVVPLQVLEAGGKRDRKLQCHVSAAIGDVFEQVCRSERRSTSSTLQMLLENYIETKGYKCRR